MSELTNNNGGYRKLKQDGARANTRVRPGNDPILGEHAGSPLHRVVQWFKTMSTNEYIRGVKQNGWAPFPGKLWHRNYWEHIIRNEQALNRIRKYIHNNPTQWEQDKLSEVRADPSVRPSVRPNEIRPYGARPDSNSPEIREPITKYTVEAWMV